MKLNPEALRVIPAYTATMQQTLDGITTPIDLTGLTVRFIMRAKAATTAKVAAAATIVDGPAGQVSYSWASTDLDTVGVYQCEWEITYPGPRTLTVPSDTHDTIIVVADLA